MIRKQLGLCVLIVAAIAFSAPALAQGRGRTDGPENSEWGKGGYSSASSNRFSLALDWGAAIEHDSGYNGTPLFVGGTVSYWSTDWFALDLSSAYLLSSKKVDVLMGPRFRTVTYPVTLGFALKAGPIFLNGGTVRFGISPQVSLDLLLDRHLIFALGYAADIPFSSGGVASRIFMTLGYRL